MADTKISALTDGSTAQSDDLIAVARNPGGSTVSRYITPAYVATYIDGTNRTISGDWTFSSAFLAQGTGNVFDAGTSLAHGGGNGTLHVHTASAGTVTAGTDYDDLTVENSGNAGISVLGGTAAYSSIVFGDSDDNDIGYVKYNHGTGTDFMYIGANATDQIVIDGPQNRIGLGTGTPDGKLHVWTATAGTVSAISTGNDLVVESDQAEMGMSFLGPDGTVQRIFFGDASDNNNGHIEYNHTENWIGLSVDGDNAPTAVLNTYGLQVGRASVENALADNQLLIGPSGSNATAVAGAQNLIIESSGGCGMTIASGNTANGTLAFGDAEDGDIGYVLYNHNTNRMVFKAATVECGMFDAFGHFNSSDDGTFTDQASDWNTFEQSGGSGSTVMVYRTEGTANNTSSWHLVCKTGGSDVAYIYGDGTASFLGGVATWSDRKLKKNIKNANSQWDDIKALTMRNFSFKDGNSKKQLGLVAQEVETVSPGLVFTAPRPGHGDLVKNINTSALQMKMLGALQEAMERIEALERKE